MVEIGDCSLTNFHHSTLTLLSPNSGQRLITSRLRLGLAIINQEETNWYQVLLFQPKKSIVTGVNISSEFIFLVHQNNEMSFKYDKNSMWNLL